MLDRRRYRPSRATALAALRARYRAAGRVTDPRARQLAARLRHLREAVVAELAGVGACAGCARRCLDILRRTGAPSRTARADREPASSWPGGLCCSGDTAALFTEDELAALRAAGTRLTDLRPPRGPHEGCIFRAEHGCTLEPAHRPTLCVRYLCTDLSRELGARGSARRVAALCDELERTFADFLAAGRATPASDGVGAASAT